MITKIHIVEGHVVGRLGIHNGKALKSPGKNGLPIPEGYAGGGSMDRLSGLVTSLMRAMVTVCTRWRIRKRWNAIAPAMASGSAFNRDQPVVLAFQQFLKRGQLQACESTPCKRM